MGEAGHADICVPDFFGPCGNIFICAVLDLSFLLPDVICFFMGGVRGGMRWVQVAVGAPNWFC